MDWTCIGWSSLIAFAGFLLGPLVIFFGFCILCCLGFTCCGIAKGSFASSVQSSYDFGEAPAGSSFSSAQSVGAQGPGGISLLCYPCLGFLTGGLTIYVLVKIDICDKL